MRLHRILSIIALFFSLALNNGCDEVDLYTFASEGAIGPDEKTFSSFYLSGTRGSIDNSSFTISLSFPEGTDVTALIPSFTIRGDHVEVTAGTVLTSGSMSFDFSSTVTFTVYAKNGTSQDYTVSVTLVTTTVAVTGVVLNNTSITIDHYTSSILIATVNPTDASDQGVSWTSSDTGVVTVSDGTINGEYPGTATVTVTTNDGGFEDYCSVVVAPVLQSIYATPANTSLTVGGTSTAITIAGNYSDSTIAPVTTDLSYEIDTGGVTDITVVISGSTVTITPGSTNGDAIVYITYTGSGLTLQCTIYAEIL